MCIAIVKPPRVTIERKLLEYSHQNNKDGMGMTYINQEGVLETFKTMDFEEFMDEYKKAFAENKDSTFLLHFRLATHGSVDEFNCHPFQINPTSVMMHNGTIHKCTPLKSEKDEKRSDTQIFNDEVLKTLPVGWEKSEGIRDMIEDYIGQSKVITMNDEGEVTIFNEGSGHWAKGCWWSNFSYYKGVRSIVKVKPTHGVHEGPFTMTRTTGRKSTATTATTGNSGSNKGNWGYAQVDRSLANAEFKDEQIFKYMNAQRFMLRRVDVDNYIWKACNNNGDVMTHGSVHSAACNDKSVDNFKRLKGKGAVSGIKRTYFPCSLCDKVSVHQDDLNVVQMKSSSGYHTHDLLCNGCVRDLQNVQATGWALVTGVSSIAEYFNAERGAI